MTDNQTSDRHKSTLRGHKIELHNAVWIYPDTKEHCSVRRDCGFCGKGDTPEGHDGCLGTLDGVMNACCGHGDVNQAYVQLPNGKRLGEQEALDFINKGENSHVE